MTTNVTTNAARPPTPPTSPPPSTPQPGSRRPTLNDRFSLWLLRLAKLRRRSLSAPQAGDDYAAFYEGFFEEKDLEAYEKDRRMVVRRETINSALARLAPPAARILDVGCGLGDVLGGLPAGDPPGYRLWGFDYAWFNVLAATRRLASRAGVCRASIYQMPYPTGAFDVALCLEVLEHIEEDARAVREIARVLKPGGFLIAAVPYGYYFPDYLRLMGHFRHYTRETFSCLMDANGLRTEAYLPNYPNFHQAYTRRYALIRAEAMTAGRVLGRGQLYDFRWPWGHRPALDKLAERLEPLRQRDALLDYSRLPTSTFLVARKPAGGPTGSTSGPAAGGNGGPG